MPNSESFLNWNDEWNKPDDQLTEHERRAMREELKAAVDRERFARGRSKPAPPPQPARPRSEERYPVPAPEPQRDKEQVARHRRRVLLSSLPLIPASIITAFQWPNLKANWEDIGSVPLWEMPWMYVALVLLLISVVALSLAERSKSHD